MTVNWKGKQVFVARAKELICVLDDLNAQIQREAKAELYPGHGYLTGALQQSISVKPARQDGNRIVGQVETRGIRYAWRIHGRYQYLTQGWRKVKPHAGATVRTYLKRGRQ